MKDIQFESPKSKIESLQAIFKNAPIEVKHLASTVYNKPYRKIKLVDMLTKQDIEPYQVDLITEAIHTAVNNYVSKFNALVLALNTIDNNEAA